MIESAFTWIHPPWSLRNRLEKRRQEQRNIEPSQPVYFRGLETTDPNNWALGGALGAAAFAAILPLRGAKIFVGGWRRYVGAAVFGAHAGDDVNDSFRNCQNKKSLEDIRIAGKAWSSPAEGVGLEYS